MLPSLGHFLIAIIGAAIVIGFFTFLNERRTKEKERAVNPTIQIAIIIVIILFFVGFLMS